MNEFDEQWNRPSFGTEEKPSAILGLIMKASGGLIKTKGQATKAALAIVVVAFALTVFLATRGGDGAPDIAETYDNFPQFLPENSPNR